MTSKRSFAWIVSVMLLCAALLPAFSLAEKAAVDTDLQGLVTEVFDGGFLMNDMEMGEVLLNVDPETVLEGVLAEKPLAVGMYVVVKYNGLLTRTTPPQTHADRLGCYPLTGTVAAMLPDAVLLSGDPLFGDVVVKLNQNMPHVFPGVPMTVYYNGTMAMSKPGKVTANHIVVPVMKGIVKAVEKDQFTLQMEKDKSLTVKLQGSTLLPQSWFDGALKGKNVTVYYDGQADHNSLTALEVVDPSSIVVANRLDATLAPESSALPSAEVEEPLPTPTPDSQEPTPAPETEAPTSAPETQEPTPTVTPAEEAPTPSPDPKQEQTPVPSASPIPTQAENTQTPAPTETQEPAPAQ